MLTLNRDFSPAPVFHTRSPAATPKVFQANIDLDVVDQLIGDIRAHTDVLDVQLGEKLSSRTVSATLDDVVPALGSEASKRALIRYVLNGTEWWDSLLVSGFGIRLVRVSQSEMWL